MSTPSDARPMRERMSEYVLDLQERTVTALEAVDPSAPKFKRDNWTRVQGGYGISCVFPPDPLPISAEAPKTVIEKAGINVSLIHGLLSPVAMKQMVEDHTTTPFDATDENAKSIPFFAAGLTLVVHPRNPNAPTAHCSYGYIEICAPDSSISPAASVAWWFGGGADLMPFYLFPEDAVHFHKVYKAACDPHGSALYPAFKRWCDEYFFIPHREEARGIGGIYFDLFSDTPHERFSSFFAENPRPKTADEIFAFVRDCGDAFVPAYVPILSRRKDLPYTAHMRRWQRLRLGRYVESNLIYDLGTKLELLSPGARGEGILLSLPDTACWEYESEMGTAEDSEEHTLVQVLKTPREWV